MPSNWPALEQKLSSAVDATYGEAFLFRPMTQPANGSPAADGTRSEKTIEAVFDEKSKHFEALGNTLGDFARVSAGMSAGAPYLSVDENEFTAGELPRRLDRFRRATSGDVYEAADIKPDGQGRLKIMLKHHSQEDVS